SFFLITRFNVAHELGHILLHNGVESIHEYSQTELKNIIEYQANLFAAHFLLPSAAFSDSLLSISLEYYIDLKKYWKVSLQSMIQKTYTLALINDDQRLYLNKRIAKNKWKTKEPYDEQLTIEQPEVFQKVYHMILEHQVIPASQLNQAFKLPKEEIEKILGTAIQTEQDKTEIVLELLRSNE
ncbi:MAG: ImmA/IrrE family metallo-endopeptidase, partial [Enterococcus faecalis]|nr:ImmA/IrrE family metallo-endopeptidase [Enterococcus faecalis]